jgi:DNA primase
MACHLAGVTTAVATCGTSFGVEHIKVLKRVLGDVANADSTGVGEVIFTFDPDEAGQKAASRAFGEEQRFAAQTFVAVAPDGLDPCDLRLKRGDDAIKRLVRSRKPMFEFMIRRMLASHDLETVEGRVSALRAAAPLVAGIRDQALLGGYVRELAGWLGLDPSEVGRAVRGAGAQAGARQKEPARPAGGEPGGLEESSGPSLRELPTDPVTRLEREALMAMLQYPEQVGKELVSRASQVRVVNSSLAVVRDGVAASIDALGSRTWLDRVIEEVPLPFAGLVKELGMAPLPERADRDLSSYCQGVTISLIERDLLARKADRLGQLQRTDPTSASEKYREIQRELISIESERRALRHD